MMPTLHSHTHCQVAQSNCTNQDLSKSMSAQPHYGKLNGTAQNEKHENLTKCIVNALSSYFQLSLQFNTLGILESASALTIHRRYDQFPRVPLCKLSNKQQ